MTDFNENDILGFDPSQLSVFNEPEQHKSAGNPHIYTTRPADSISEDGIYRATIKVIYNPFDFKHSVLEQQSYAIHDDQGWLTVVSSLTNNDKSCPIFTAWKKCHFAEEKSPLWRQAAREDQGGKNLFDKRFARYVTIQVIEDKNKPELEGQYLFWKLPKSVWDIINAKMKPSAESKKAAIPIMDFLFGRTIDIEVTPGPDDPKNPERKQRETKYMAEISEDCVACTAPDGTSLMTADEEDVLDKYVTAMREVWRTKDPETRVELMAAINADPNTVQLKALYRKVLDKIKEFCPNLIEELGYNEWPENVRARVQKWIDNVLALKDPAAGDTAVPEAVNDVAAAPTAAPEPQAVSSATVNTDDGDDLPF